MSPQEAFDACRRVAKVLVDDPRILYTGPKHIRTNLTAAARSIGVWWLHDRVGLSYPQITRYYLGNPSGHGTAIGAANRITLPDVMTDEAVQVRAALESGQGPLKPSVVTKAFWAMRYGERVAANRKSVEATLA